MLLGRLFSMLSPAGSRARLSVLIYHRVLPEPDPMLPAEVDAATFRWHLRLIKRFFNPLPLPEAVRRLYEGNLPSRALCVTFDDGYADNATTALPILLEAGVPATFFIATDYLDGGMMFNDRIIETIRRLPAGSHDLEALGLGQYPLDGPETRVSAYSSIIRQVKYLPFSERERLSFSLADLIDGGLPANLMMRRDQVQALSQAGMNIGGHTASHPILLELADHQALEEMKRGRRVLEDLLGEPVRFFAYPNGKPGRDYDARHVAMVRELGFTAAVTTASGVSVRASDIHQLPRFTPWDQTPARFAARLARNLTNKTPLTV